MSGSGRFPKPDVPWLHEVEPDLEWPIVYGAAAVVVSSNGRWEAAVRDGRHPEPCPSRRPRGDGVFGGWCSLPRGHECPHLATRRGDVMVTSLRRVAQPAEATP